VQRPETGLLGGLWEFPTADVAMRPRGPAAARAFLERSLGLRGRVGAPLGTVRHLFTHRDLRLTLYPVEVTGGTLRVDGYPAHRWIRPGEAKRFPLSALTEKVCERLTDREPGRRKR
jgi:A/G-specific adenine glycosylase